MRSAPSILHFLTFSGAFLFSNMCRHNKTSSNLDNETQSHTHLSLHNLQLTNADLQKKQYAANIFTFSPALAPSLDSGLLSAVWRRGAQHDNWLTITNQWWVPPPDLCTLTLTPAHHTAALNILTHGETGYFYCLWVWRIKLLKYYHCQASAH